MAAAEAHPGVSATRRTSREAVAVFCDHDDLLAAIEDFELAGFDRAQISLLTSCKAAERRLGRAVRDVRELEGEPRVPLGAWVDRHERAEGRAALAAGLAYVGSFTAIGVVVADGGEFASAIAAAAAAGGGGCALGLWLADVLGRPRARAIQEQLRRGGLPLWVETHGPEQERTALAILERHATRDVHLHDLARPWDAGRALRHPSPPAALLPG
jgi:hypothetical protein